MAGGGDGAAVKYDDRGGIADGGEAVGDDEDRFADDEVFEGELDGGLAIAIEGAGGLVENENGGVAEKGAGEGDPLFLAAGETGAAFANDGLIALWKV